MPPNQQQNPYEFINNSGAPPSRFGNFTSTTKGRAIVIGIGAVILIIFIVILLSFLNADSRAQRDRLIEITKAQNEIIQISDIVLEKSQDNTTRAIASTASLAVTTSQSEVNQALGSRGFKVSDKFLEGSTDGTLESQLERAAESNQLEEAYKDMLRTRLANYQKLLHAAYGSGNVAEDQLLQSAFNQSELLAKDLN